MDTRQSKLLAAIIDQFIHTAEPVGSKQILAQCDFTVSGATIRNEMRALGDEGYLDQPHISAGRVPTAKGYRLYVKNSLFNADLNAVLGGTVLVGVVFITLNMLSDLIYPLVDPRARDR